MEYQRAQYASLEAQVSADAAGLINEAERLSALRGQPVEPEDSIKRSTDTDEYLEALRAEIAKRKGAALDAALLVEAAQPEAAQPEAAELDPRLKTFKADYDSDASLKGKITWQEIKARLLANNGHYLALAQAMEQGGVLFGVDKSGNPLIADRGDEPIMKGMSYKDTRDRVLYKHDRYDRDGQMQRDESGQPISTGYEMFPYIPNYDKSPEITDYETHTGKPFVKSPKGGEFRSSWAESGEAPSWPRFVRFNPGFGSANVDSGYPQLEAYNRGVRRLLRVKKT